MEAICEIPKSRKVELDSGEVPPGFGLTDYLYYIYDCRLPKEMKRSLIYYATRFNWQKRTGTYVSLSRAANDLGVGRKYLSKAMRDLEEYGWVSITENKSSRTYRVTIRIGREVETERWPEPGAKQKQLEEQHGF